MTSSIQIAQINGIQLAYERSGQGFPILFIHGFPRDHRLWRKVIPQLTDRFDAVASDRRGYGESDRPLDADSYVNESMAADAIQLTRQLGWERFIVVAHDLGGTGRAATGGIVPEKVVGAVLLDSLPQGAGRADRRDPTGRSWYMDFHRQRGVAEQLIGQNPRLYFSLFLDKLIGMGARIVLCDPHRAVISGPSPLKGGIVESPDIRAGMAMLLAALAADGSSTIHNVGQIERGYERIDERLRALGADIERADD